MFDIALKHFYNEYRNDYYCWDCFFVLIQSMYKPHIDMNSRINE
jgi:hypothetical protein